jgi:hypothetical protein
MSAIGPKRTCLVALQMSAFGGGKADVVRPLLSAFQRVKKPAPLVGHRTDAERPFWQDQTQMVPWGR